MKIELKSVKYFASLSEETNCFQATVWIDGKKVGTAENLGHGGPTDIDFNDRRQEDKFIAYAKSLPPTVYPARDNLPEMTIESSADGIIDTLFDEYLAKKDEDKLDKEGKKMREANMKKGLMCTIRIKTSRAYYWKGLVSESQVPQAIEKMSEVFRSRNEAVVEHKVLK